MSQERSPRTRLREPPMREAGKKRMSSTGSSRTACRSRSRNVYIPSDFGFSWEVDLLYRHARLVIEVSPHGIHGDPDVYAKDVRKREDLEAQGYKVIVVTDETTRSEFLGKVRKHLGV